MKDVTIVLASTELNDDGLAYAVTRVYRFDFQGSAQDLERLFKEHEDLFIEGGQMKNS